MDSLEFVSGEILQRMKKDSMFNLMYFFSYEATCASLYIACHPVLICLGGLCKFAFLCQHEVMVSWDSSIKFFRKFALSVECPWAHWLLSGKLPYK